MVQLLPSILSADFARLADEVVNVSPEFDDVVRAAAALGRPVKAVLAAAAAAAHDRAGS